AALRNKMSNAVQRIRVVFKFAADNGLIDRVVRFGQGFQRPRAKVLRLHRAKQGPKLFTAEEIHRFLDGYTAQGDGPVGNQLRVWDRRLRLAAPGGPR